MIGVAPQAEKFHVFACRVRGIACHGFRSGELIMRESTHEVAADDPWAFDDFLEFRGRVYSAAEPQQGGAVWTNGVLTALPTWLGGHNSQVYWMNSLGAIVGVAETGVPDATCIVASQKYRYVATKWDASGQPTPLAPLAGDTVSFGFGINDSGQAVGVSGLCSDTVLPPNAEPAAPHAVLWQKDGTPVDLGTLPGGVGNNIAGSINNHGQVVGTALLNDSTVHAFVWSAATGMRDLGSLPGAFATIPPCCHTINDRGDIVGFSGIAGYRHRQAGAWGGEGANVAARRRGGGPTAASERCEVAGVLCVLCVHVGV